MIVRAYVCVFLYRGWGYRYFFRACVQIEGMIPHIFCSHISLTERRFMLDKERLQEQGRAMAMKASQLGKNICSTERARELNKLATQKRKENNQRAKSLQETAKFFMKLAVDKKLLIRA